MRLFISRPAVAIRLRVLVLIAWKSFPPESSYNINIRKISFVLCVSHRTQPAACSHPSSRTRLVVQIGVLIRGREGNAFELFICVIIIVSESVCGLEWIAASAAVGNGFRDEQKCNHAKSLHSEMTLVNEHYKIWFNPWALVACSIW